MSNHPEELLYSEEHEWVRLEGDVATVGVTYFAQDELGEVVFVELPVVGERVEADTEIGTIESVKAVAEVYSPLAGEVVEVNEALADAPERVNEDPYGEGWLIKIRRPTTEPPEGLMDAARYREFTNRG